MSYARMKVCMLTAVCAGLVGITSGTASAHGCGAGCGGGAVVAYGHGGCGDGCGPATRRVTVTEYVPTWVDQVVTTHRTEYRQEAYTAHRWECVPEVVTKQVTHWKPVCETVMVNKTIVERIPVTKTITVNETHWTTEMVTEMRTKTVHHKVQVPYCYEKGPSLMDRFKSMRDCCYTPCPRVVSGCRTETVCETVCCPVTVCKKVAHCVPCTKTICTYECVSKCVQVPCTVHKCVPVCENVTCTVMVKKCVPYTCTRCVPVCVPCTHTVKVCKLVPVCKEIDVPCAPACAPACNPCGPVCCDPCGKGSRWGGFMSRLRGGKGGCCEVACAPSCCH